MANSTVWWICAGVAVGLELVTGTFYLLMIGMGLIAGAVAAHLGANVVVQLLVAAAVGGGTVIAWYARQSRRPRTPEASANRDVNLDIGETVQVEAWKEDGTADVQYRGANWTALSRSGSPRATGTHRVAEVIGSRLVVDKV